MTTLTETEFLAWAEGQRLCLDERYPDSAVLMFQTGAEQDRFWEVPLEPERRPYFILSLLKQMGDWQHCYAWRHLGSWPESADPLRINDSIELRILEGLGLPLGTADIVKFERQEMDKLVTLMFATTIFGWSVGEDLYVVPDHARYFLQTDHHNVIHVSFRYAADVGPWAKQMEEVGFPLPKEVPDSTFKRPHWMEGDG